MGGNRSAQESEASALRTQTDGTPTFLATGDLDRDGRAELVLTEPANDRVRVLRRQPGGSETFLAPQSIATASPDSALIAPLDSNGTADLAIVSSSTMSLELRFQNPSIAFDFSNSTSLASGSETRPTLALDVDRDSRLDLLSPLSAEGVIELRRNLGAGSFDVAQQIATGDRPVSIASLDFNADGLIDILVAQDSADVLSLILQDAANPGSFLEPRVLTLPNPTEGERGLRVQTFDLNADGRQDIVLTSCLVSAPAVGRVSLLLCDPNRSSGLAASRLSIENLDLSRGPQCAAIVQGLGSPLLATLTTLGVNLDFTFIESGQLRSAPLAELSLGRSIVGLAAARFNADRGEDLIAVTEDGRVELIELR